MLIGVELVSEIVGTTFMTGALSTDDPVSLMLIAAPESGKTSIVTTPELEEKIICSDATGGGICEQLMLHQKVHHIIISDMVAVMAHKEATNKRTWAILNAMTDEGLEKIALPGSTSFDFKRRKAGVICCIPLEMVNDGRAWWQRTGFSSRYLPFCYEYSQSLILQIKKDVIVSGAYERRNHREEINLPDKKITIQIKPGFDFKIQSIADKVAKRLDEKGLRRGKQLRALARGHALYKKRKEVNDDDMAFLTSIYPFVSYSEAQEL